MSDVQMYLDGNHADALLQLVAYTAFDWHEQGRLEKEGAVLFTERQREAVRRLFLASETHDEVPEWVKVGDERAEQIQNDVERHDQRPKH